MFSFGTPESKHPYARIKFVHDNLINIDGGCAFGYDETIASGKIAGFTVYGIKGSSAEKYAKRNHKNKKYLNMY